MWLRAPLILGAFHCVLLHGCELRATTLANVSASHYHGPDQILLLNLILCVHWQLVGRRSSTLIFYEVVQAEVIYLLIKSARSRFQSHHLL